MWYIALDSDSTRSCVQLDIVLLELLERVKPQQSRQLLDMSHLFADSLTQLVQNYLAASGREQVDPTPKAANTLTASSTAET